MPYRCTTAPPVVQQYTKLYSATRNAFCGSRDISRTQTKHCGSHFACAVHSHHPTAATEWSSLLLHDVICSERVIMHCQWGYPSKSPFLSVVTSTFDLWPWPSNSSERGTKHVFPWREFAANPFNGSRNISYTIKMVTDIAKNRTQHSWTVCGKSVENSDSC